jgi:hypothetical protein
MYCLDRAKQIAHTEAHTNAGRLQYVVRSLSTDEGESQSVNSSVEIVMQGIGSILHSPLPNERSTLLCRKYWSANGIDSKCME